MITFWLTENLRQMSISPCEGNQNQKHLTQYSKSDVIFCSNLDKTSGNYVFWLQILAAKKESADEGAEISGKNSLTDR